MKILIHILNLRVAYIIKDSKAILSGNIENLQIKISCA